LRFVYSRIGLLFPAWKVMSQRLRISTMI